MPYDTTTQKNAKDSFRRKAEYKKGAKGEFPFQRKARIVQAKTVLLGLKHNL